MRGLLLLLLVPVAGAFASLPPGEAPHDVITLDAAEAVGWPEGGIGALQEAVRAPDVEEMRVEPHADDPARIDAADGYDPSHHCDRVPPADDLASFTISAQYVRQQRDAAAHAMANGSAEAAVEHLGRALHALQDCFSHSNYVDLDDGEQDRFVRALLDGASAPEGVKLTAFEPGADEPGNPDDPYPHDQFAKDGPDHNGESRQMLGNMTKYRHAHDGALQGSAAVMATFLGPLDASQRQQLADLRRSDGSAESLPLPVWLAAAALAGCAARRK